MSSIHNQVASSSRAGSLLRWHNLSKACCSQLGSPADVSFALQTFEAILEDQASMCQEILQMEEQAGDASEDRSGQKWPLLTLARLREVQHQLSSPANSACPEAQWIYQTLIEIDPFRKGYYIDAMHGKAAQITRSLNSSVTASS